MDYYKQLKDKILNKETYDKIKDYSKEKNTVITYYEIGEILHQAGKHYGEGIIQKYANSLEKDFGKKYNKRSLFRMRQFYVLYNRSRQSLFITKSQKVSSLETQSTKSLYLKGNHNQKVSSLGTSVFNPSSFIYKTIRKICIKT